MQLTTSHQLRLGNTYLTMRLLLKRNTFLLEYSLVCMIVLSMAYCGHWQLKCALFRRLVRLRGSVNFCGRFVAPDREPGASPKKLIQAVARKINPVVF